MMMKTLRMSNANEAKELENQIAERNKSMSKKTYYMATVSSSELDFEEKATNEKGQEIDNSIGATLIFNLGDMKSKARGLET